MESLMDNEYYNKGYMEGKEKSSYNSFNNGLNDGINEGLSKGYYYGYLKTIKDYISTMDNEKYKKIENKIQLMGNIQDENIVNLRNMYKLTVSNLERLSKSQK
jgi:flagellar biosynthesis/type III secretory pathway protein FliH